jgi:hypothetical protein
VVKAAVGVHRDLRAGWNNPTAVSGILKTAGRLSAEGIENLRSRLERFRGAANRIKTLILERIAGISPLPDDRTGRRRGCGDGAPINRTRVGDGAFTLRGRRLAAHMMLQSVAARPPLSDPVAA